tara:strand:+ start:2396 stop:2767 length:372 start_codon:yes stop_codon:yes gene_type:complete
MKNVIKEKTWVVQETKENLTTGKNQHYDITIQVVRENDIINVLTSVNICPRGQRPTTWHSGNVADWLKQKGYNIEKVIRQQTLKDIEEGKAEYVFSLKKEKKVLKPLKSNESVTKASPNKAVG